MSALSLPDLQAALADPRVRVINVLSPEVFRIARIPGTVNLPLDQLPGRAAEALPDRTQRIIAYCGGPT